MKTCLAIFSTSDIAPKPIRYDWLAQVAVVAQRTKALHLGAALAWLAATKGSSTVSLTRRTLARWGISRDAASDALKILKSHKLIVVRSLPGRSHQIVLLEPGTSDRPLMI
jgi:hypothetical protein